MLLSQPPFSLISSLRPCVTPEDKLRSRVAV
jgi:hypothetical protein